MKEPDGLKNRLELVPSVQGTPATMMLLQVNWLGSYRENGQAGARPSEHWRQVLSALENVIATDLVDAIRRRIPLVWHSTKRGVHELMPDGRSPNDPGRAVIEWSRVWIPDPDCRRQGRRVANRPIILEILRRLSLVRDLAAEGG